MARVILFGGGDGGGLIIGPNGVRPIPPFDPGLRLQLRAVSALTQATLFTAAAEQKELTGLATRVANHAIGQLEAVVGTLDPDASVVYQDEDGGFTCGSTGKPPIPFPWPPRQVPGIEDLVSQGILERELVQFLKLGKKIEVADLLEDPAGVAQKSGIKLSQRSVEQLSRLAPSRIQEIPDEEGREVAQFFHKVVADGRFLETWSRRPLEAAAVLGVELSRGATDRIVAGGNAVIRPGGGGEAANAVAIAVIVGIVIMLVPTEAGRVPINIRDRSGLVKF